MRILLIFVFLALSASAGAQYPGGQYYAPAYPPPPGYPLPQSYAPRQVVPASSIPEAMLDAHNGVRARVGIPPLIWSDALATVAQDWANHLIAANAFSHRPDNRFGENLYAMTGGTASPADAVGMWADEARGYDIRGNACSGVCGHYTQIVWRQTRAVGCATAATPYRQVWVCNYDPPGNFVGYRPY